MSLLEHLFDIVHGAGALVRLAPARFSHRTRQSMAEYFGVLVVLGAVGLAAASVGVV